MSQHADTLYLADTKFFFFEPSEQKHETTTGLSRVKLPPDWPEFVGDWFAMGPQRPYIFSLMDKIPTSAVFDSDFDPFIRRFSACYI